MDPNGGVNPSNPRLDTVGAQPNAAQNPAQVTAPTLESPNPGVAQQPMQSTVPADQTLLVPQSKQSNHVLKKILIAFGIIIVLAGLAGGGYFVGYSTGKGVGRKEADAAYQQQQAQAQQEEAESGESDASASGQLDLGDLREPKYVDETIEGEIGKQVSASDGLVLKVVNIERNFQTTDQNYKLDSSKELVKVNFLLGNVANDKPKDISNFAFKLEDSTGALLVPENIAEYEDKFDTIKIDQGAQAKASIIYKVNKDEKPLKFVREQRYRITTENREVTTKIVITLVK